ncbi:winged helix-turn-helix domain-containing protein [Streptomyces sp. NPDC014684]|uniref:winged helix-turn-helix domain-containing protein n=1 Tax=Streptomyces sp. NPDC014684 TaxID=3364880 RepID=UPI0036FC14C5
MIGRLFHVAYTVEGTWRLLKRYGCSWQQPTRRAIERDDDAVEVGRKAQPSLGKSTAVERKAWIVFEGEASFGWRDFRDLMVRARIQLGRPIVHVWNNVRLHLTAGMRDGNLFAADLGQITRAVKRKLTMPSRGHRWLPRRHRPIPGPGPVSVGPTDLQFVEAQSRWPTTVAV